MLSNKRGFPSKVLRTEVLVFKFKDFNIMN